MTLFSRGMEAKNLIIAGSLPRCGLNKDNMLRSTNNLILIDFVEDFNFVSLSLSHWDTLVPYTENSQAFEELKERMRTNKYIAKAKGVYHTCVKNIGRSRQRFQYKQFEDAEVAEFAKSSCKIQVNILKNRRLLNF